MLSLGRMLASSRKPAAGLVRLLRARRHIRHCTLAFRRRHVHARLPLLVRARPGASHTAPPLWLRDPRPPRAKQGQTTRADAASGRPHPFPSRSAVKTSKAPPPLDPDEPENVSKAIAAWRAISSGSLPSPLPKHQNHTQKTPRSDLSPPGNLHLPHHPTNPTTRQPRPCPLRVRQGPGLRRPHLRRPRRPPGPGVRPYRGDHPRAEGEGPEDARGGPGAGFPGGPGVRRGALGVWRIWTGRERGRGGGSVVCFLCLCLRLASLTRRRVCRLRAAAQRVALSGLDVYAHNVETARAHEPLLPPALASFIGQ